MFFNSLRKSIASSTLSSKETNFSYVYKSLSFLLGFTFKNSVFFDNLSSNYPISSYYFYICIYLNKI